MGSKNQLDWWAMEEPGSSAIFDLARLVQVASPFESHPPPRYIEGVDTFESTLMRKKTYPEHLVVEFLSARQEIEFAYIFGSFASGEKYHDIDIAVYLNQTTCLADRATYPYGYESDLLGNLTALLRTDAIDLVILNRASLTLFMRVIKYGRLVVERDRLRRIHIENNIRKQFIDTAHLRVMRDRSIANTISRRHV